MLDELVAECFGIIDGYFTSTTESELFLALWPQRRLTKMGSRSSVAVAVLQLSAVSPSPPSSDSSSE